QARAAAEGRPSAGEAAAAPRPFGLIAEEVRRQLPADVEDAYPLSSSQAGPLRRAAAPRPPRLADRAADRRPAARRPGRPGGPSGGLPGGGESPAFPLRPGAAV